jgi:hypothetical protein
MPDRAVDPATLELIAASSPAIGAPDPNHCNNQRFESWLPLADALRNFVFDPSPDFLALIHTLRIDPLPGLTAL